LLSTQPVGHLLLAAILIIIGIFLIRLIFRVTFKLTFIVAVIGLFMVVFFGYTPDAVFNKGRQMATYTTSYIESTVKPAIYNGLKNAHVEKGPNGTVDFIGDHFEIGQTPGGKFIFHVYSLNLSISQDDLAKYLNKNEMEKLLQTLQQKTIQ
jgi:drug/metabolite transporter superfamily protein YnfA